MRKSGAASPPGEVCGRSPAALGCSRRLVRQIRDGETPDARDGGEPGSFVDGTARMAGDHP